MGVVNEEAGSTFIRSGRGARGEEREGGGEEKERYDSCVRGRVNRLRRIVETQAEPTWHARGGLRCPEKDVCLFLPPTSVRATRKRRCSLTRRQPIVLV